MKKITCSDGETLFTDNNDIIIDRSYNIKNVYQDFQSMIYHRAIQISNMTRINLNDLLAEGNLIFVETYIRYDPNKNAEFSTYLYTRLFYCLMNYAKRELRQDNIARENKRSDHYITCDNLDALFDEIDNKDVKRILKLVFFEIPKNIKITMGYIKKTLREENWSYSRINKSFYEMKNFLRTA